MGNFVEEFKAHRESHSISLEEISERTKINIRFLEAIEEGNFDILPETYIRLFLRAYAIEIGIDPDEAIEKYELSRGQRKSEETGKSPRSEESRDQEEFDESAWDSSFPLSSQSTINWKRAAIVVILAGFVIWAVKSYVSDTATPESAGMSADNATSQIDTIPDTLEQNPGATGSVTDQQFEGGEIVDASQQELNTVQPDEEIVLSFEAVDRTWVRVQRDTFPSQEYIFLPQDSRTWRANNRIQLRIGNSAGARLNLNGQVIDSLGAPNTVTDLVINRNGILDKTTVIPSNQAVQSDTLTD